MTSPHLGSRVTVCRVATAWGQTRGLVRRGCVGTPDTLDVTSRVVLTRLLSEELQLSELSYCALHFAYTSRFYLQLHKSHVGVELGSVESSRVHSRGTHESRLAPHELLGLRLRASSDQVREHHMREARGRWAALERHAELH